MWWPRMRIKPYESTYLAELGDLGFKNMLEGHLFPVAQPQARIDNSESTFAQNRTDRVATVERVKLVSREQIVSGS